MGTSRIRPKVRRRKVAQLAANSRKFTVKNNTIPTVDSSNLVEIEKPWGKVSAVKGTVDYKIEHHSQPKSLRKKYKKKYYNKGTHTIRKIVEHPSDYVQFPDTAFHPKGIAWYCEQLVQHKTARWEKKHPRPIKENVNEPDLFEAQYIPKWEAERNAAIERIRNFVVSVYDKLPVMGNIVDRKNRKIKAIKIGEIRDVDGKGHNVNHPNLSPNDKLYKHAEDVAMSAMKMDKRILDADLLNHKRDQKRPLNITRQSVKKAA